MKRKEIGTLINALDGVAEVKGVKFAFSVLKNRKKLETQIEEDKSIFEEILKPSDGFKEFGYNCKYNTCNHTNVNGCDVIKRVNAGKILKSRYDSYVKLIKEENHGSKWQFLK